MTDSRTELRWSCLPFAALSPARLYRMLALRSAVFVVEQRCAYLDPDGVDEVGWMLLAETPDDAVVATARLLGPGVRFAEPSIGRVCTAMDWRGTGLGRALIQECFAQALELGLRKFIARMTLSQARAIAVFKELGFRPEALLSRHVADRTGVLHDLVVLGHDVEAVAARQALYGLPEALDASEPA